jgi:hypothetical protein
LENLKFNSPITNEIARLFSHLKINLGILDLGCSGGPDNIFMEIYKAGVLVNYHGYDFNDEEIKRLRSEFPNNFNFHSKKIITDQQIEMDGNSFFESSAGQASAEADIRSLSEKQIVDNNLWASSIVDKSKDEIRVQEINIDTKLNFDILKIDLDGPDFGYLQDFFSNPNHTPQFVSVEINYQGSGNANSNTFHNTDRFMKNLGFDLVAITSRTYSSKALPSRFQFNIFAQTLKGIPLQGDALYFRISKYGSVEDILRDVIILDAFNLEDIAARIILENSSIIGGKESTAILNALTKEVWGDTFESYEALMKMWKENKTFFHPIINDSPSELGKGLSHLRIRDITKELIFRIYKKFRSMFIN